jgi:RNA polymerase sigma-70 factor (ECF subfamily)
MTEPRPDHADDDAALVLAVRGGRTGAFAQLVERYERLVAALVARTTGGRGETADLVQDVFCEAWKKLATLEDPRRVKGWLMAMAMNRARGSRRRRAVEEAAMPRVARSGAAAPEEAALDREEDRRRTIEALRELPEEMQVVITLRYLEGRSGPQIAEVLGTTGDAVRTRLSRALAQLRERLVAKKEA